MWDRRHPLTHAANPRHLAAINAMTATLEHRGPNGEGWLDRGGGVAQPTFNNASHHGLSTFRRQRRVLVNVHSVPPRTTVCLATSAFTAGIEWTTS